MGHNTIYSLKLYPIIRNSKTELNIIFENIELCFKEGSNIVVLDNTIATLQQIIDMINIAQDYIIAYMSADEMSIILINHREEKQDVDLIINGSMLCSFQKTKV